MELKLLHGVKRRTGEMEMGEKLHMKLSYRDHLPKPDNFTDWLGYQLYLSNLSLNELKSKGYAKEIFIIARIEPWGWYLTGSVDELRLFGTRSQIVEVKTTKNTRIPKNEYHRLQVMLYRRMLEEMIDQDYSKNLQRAYGLSRRDVVSDGFAELAGIRERRILDFSSSLTAKLASIPRPADECRLRYLSIRSGKMLGEVWFAADDERVDATLSFARSYWTGERDARKTEDRWKCRFCEVRGLCDQNLFI